MSAIIPVAVKKTVWKKYFNNREIGKCCICGGKIVRSEFHAGHIVSNYNGGPAILENLIPMCSSCNQSINRHNLVDFMERWGYSIPSSLKEISRMVKKKIRSKFLFNNITPVVPQLKKVGSLENHCCQLTIMSHLCLLLALQT